MTEPYRTRVEDVPLERGLRREEGWIDMRVQFLIDAGAAGSDQLVVGRTVLPPGARHERHRHPNCNEFLVVISGRGEIYTDEGTEPSEAGIGPLHPPDPQHRRSPLVIDAGTRREGESQARSDQTDPQFPTHPLQA